MGFAPKPTTFNNYYPLFPIISTPLQCKLCVLRTSLRVSLPSVLTLARNVISNQTATMGQTKRTVLPAISMM